ncbi:B2L14 protein, partial [Brachypteracias leptosomus]|nr:B2L14 protein [Brachypteracias leptosomus]
GTKMYSPNYDSMEEILLEDDGRDSIEYKILMAYAQRRLSVSKYRKLLKNEANVQTSSSLIRGKVKIDHQRDKYRSKGVAVLQGGGMKNSKEQPSTKYLPGYRLHFDQGRAEEKLLLQGPDTARSCISGAESEITSEGHSQHQTSERADVNHIADKLAKLVTSRSQESPSDVSCKIKYEAPLHNQGFSDLTGGSEDKEHDKEKIIQTIVSLLRQSGDELEEKMKKDRVLWQCFKDMLSYSFFERITDLFLKDVSAASKSEPEGQAQCMKVAFTMEVATRLTAVDNHPMNLVLGFGLKYLREHFKSWIQEQGGW